MSKFFFVALFALALSGCGGSPKPNLSSESLSALRLTGVEVTIAPGATIHHSDAQDQAQARAQAAADANEPVGDVMAQSAAYQRERVGAVVNSVFVRQVTCH